MSYRPPRENTHQRGTQRPPRGRGGSRGPHGYPTEASSQPPPIRLVPGQPPPFPGPPSHFQQGNHRPQRPPSQWRNKNQQGHHSSRSSSQTFSENQFQVHPLHRFRVKCAPFQQPTEIGSFSYSEQREFIMDDSQLTYYYPPDLSTCKNLSINYDKYITRDPMIDEHIDALLDALICIRDREEQEQQQPQQTESKSSTQQKEDSQDGRDDDHATTTSSRPIPQKSSTKADFVCYRGILTKIMCTPYSRNDPWELRATLYKGTIYIEEHVSDEKRKDAHGVDDRHKLMSYWGYRFETICNISKPVSELQRIQTKKRRQQSDQGDRTDSVDKSDDNDGDHEMVEEVDPNDPELTGRLDGIANTNIQYCTVARTKLGRHSVIMGAEVDCTSEPKKPLPHNPLANYIELKTSRIISNARERNNFEKYKLIKFWAQSFLPGIPTIIVGFRDDDGNVVTVETFKTMEIPRLVRGKDGAWDSTVCINFLDGVFDFLRKIIVVDDPKATYTIRWDAPFEAIEVEYEGKVNDFLTERFLDRWSRVQ